MMQIDGADVSNVLIRYRACRAAGISGRVISGVYTTMTCGPRCSASQSDLHSCRYTRRDGQGSRVLLIQWDEPRRDRLGVRGMVFCTAGRCEPLRASGFLHLWPPVQPWTRPFGKSGHW